MSAPRTKAEKAAQGTAETATQEVARRELEDLVPEVMGQSSNFDESSLRDLATFDAALAMVEQAHGTVLDASQELGDGFTLLSTDQKGRLEGLPLILMEWAFRPGDFGMPFVSVRLVARMPGGGIGKFILNDGSTGIAEQLAKFTKQSGKMGGLVVRNGLRKSEYDKEIPDGRGGTTITHATTWYLDTSA